MGEELTGLLLVLQGSRKAWERKKEEEGERRGGKEWVQLLVAIRIMLASPFVR